MLRKCLHRCATVVENGSRKREGSKARKKREDFEQKVAKETKSGKRVNRQCCANASIVAQLCFVVLLFLLNRVASEGRRLDRTLRIVGIGPAKRSLKLAKAPIRKLLLCCRKKESGGLLPRLAC